MRIITRHINRFQQFLEKAKSEEVKDTEKKPKPNPVPKKEPNPEDEDEKDLVDEIKEYFDNQKYNKQ